MFTTVKTIKTTYKTRNVYFLANWLMTRYKRLDRAKKTNCEELNWRNKKEKKKMKKKEKLGNWRTI